MKVDDSQEDRYGRPVFVFTGVKKFEEVYDWLFTHYNGYKFGIVLDCSQPEREEPDNKIYVNFLDELSEEVMAEAGYIYDCESRIFKPRNKVE